MAENYGFFNAVEQDGVYDRVYDASSVAKIFSLFMTNGVFANPTNQLKVVAKSGLTLTVRTGNAFIDGYWYELTEEKDVTLSANTTAFPSYAYITVKLDKNARTITIDKRENLTVFEVVNDGTVHELILAMVRIDAGASVITDSNITDYRNTANCGFVKGAVEQISSQELFKQYESIFNNFMDAISGKLTDDVAGSLRADVLNLNGGTTTNMLDETKTSKTKTVIEWCDSDSKQSGVFASSQFFDSYSSGKYLITMNLYVAMPDLSMPEANWGDAGFYFARSLGDLSKERIKGSVKHAFMDEFGSNENADEVTSLDYLRFSASTVVKIGYGENFVIDTFYQIFNNNHSRVATQITITKLGGFID